MSITSRLLGLIMGATVAFGGYAFAGEAAVQGTVRDANGNVVPNAEIKIEMKDGSAWNKRTTTDAKGRYYYSGLTPGQTYRVSLLVGGTAKASINNVQTHSGSATDLNFELKEKSNATASAPTAKKKTHMVYMPAETGSNLGGRWVEVDDQTDLNSQQTVRAQRATSGALGRMQGGTTAGTAGGNGN